MNRLTVLIVCCVLLCGGLFAQTEKQKPAESPPRVISISDASAQQLTQMQLQIDKSKAEAQAAISKWQLHQSQQESLARVELVNLYKTGKARSNEDCSINFDDKAGWLCICKPESPGQSPPKQE